MATACEEVLEEGVFIPYVAVDHSRCCVPCDIYTSFPCSGSKGVCLSLSFHHASICIIFLMLVSPNLATNMRLMPQSVF